MTDETAMRILDILDAHISELEEQSSDGDHSKYAAMPIISRLIKVRSEIGQEILRSSEDVES